jgi:two-component system cell cycle response regulator CtrA
MRVLLIEDEPTTARAIELMLTTEGFNVYSTDLGEEGLDLGKLYDYDIILLDLNLPDMHGYDVLKKLRVAKVQTPVLILSGISEMDSQGALVRLRRRRLCHQAVPPRRTGRPHPCGCAPFQGPFAVGHPHRQAAVNLDAKTVEVDGARVHLTGKEYAMLELLSLRKGTTLTKEMFLNHLYGGMDEPELKIIDVFICKLRKKLAQACGGANYIETVWGRGYVLRDVDDTRAVRPAIDQVAEEDDLRVRPPLCPVIGIDPGEQGLQQIIAAMNVTDGIDAHAIGHPRAIERAGRRGFLEQATQHGARHIGSGTLKGK